MKVIEAVNRYNFLNECESVLERLIENSRFYGYSEDCFVLRKLLKEIKQEREVLYLKINEVEVE